jgi:uncharacterized membrane protein
VTTHGIAAIAFGFGFVAGLRTMIALAAVAFERRALVYAAIASVAAVAELIADKLPKTPSRLVPRMLLFRCVIGAVCGYVVMGGVWSVVIGIAGALAGSYAGAAFRRTFTSRSAAFFEDGVALGLAAFLAAMSR